MVFDENPMRARYPQGRAFTSRCTATAPQQLAPKFPMRRYILIVIVIVTLIVIVIATVIVTAIVIVIVIAREIAIKLKRVLVHFVFSSHRL